MFLTPQANFWRHSIINIQNLFILLDSHLLKIVLSCPQGLLKNNKHLVQKNTSWLEFPISSFHFSDSTSLDVYMATTYTNYTLIWMHSSTMSLGRGSWIISYYITCFLLVYLTFISIKSTTRTMLKSCLVQIKCLIYVSVHNLYYYYKSVASVFWVRSPTSDRDKASLCLLDAALSVHLLGNRSYSCSPSFFRLYWWVSIQLHRMSQDYYILCL